MHRTFDVVIVGGGIAGLTAALYLARGGKRVAVLESQQRMGGRAITNQKEGVRFNLGSHALYEGDARRVFQELGLNPDLFRKVDEFKPFGIWKEQVHLFPASMSFLLKSSMLTISEKVMFAGLLMRILKMDVEAIPRISLRAWMEQNVRSPMLRHMLYVMARGGTYVQAPDLQEAGPLFRQMQRSIAGVYYVKRGWGALIEHLCEEAQRLGVALLTGRKVTAVGHEDGCVRHILCADGETIEAAYVILATPPGIARNLVPNSDATSLKTWDEQAIPVTAACLDIGLRRLPVPDRQFVYGIDQPIMMVNASRIHGLDMSDDGDVQVFQMIKFQNQDGDAGEDRRQLEAALDLIHPGWKREVVTEQYLPRMTVVHDFMHLKRKQNLGPAVPEIKGLYVAGDWATHGEYLVNGAAASAKRAAEHILAQ
ncbi:phytoene desaturase family protein [Brevibacillus panacihumi]|uniref:4,4'-diaponeurosporene oxygenase n=1 Tax=Brevibacillus panacihumi TaxID=497735 RepID=A0A3M8C5G8_9BACL|nr:NAD(P)/FAD-dependent oxidoreductase [Brevibacillus panacihumi]RNB70926.1 NAD(P)/FAD-dependent oxidoreductase [Brevibacillus panacihumi]